MTFPNRLAGNAVLRSAGVLFAAVLLAVLVMVMADDSSAAGASDFTTTDGVTYHPDGTEATVVGYTGDGGELVIPQTVTDPNTQEEYSVTAIGSHAFVSFKADLITGITISGTVAVGDHAFDGMAGLVSADIYRVTSMGAGIFQGCVSLQTVSISSGVDRIPDAMFKGCVSLTAIPFADVADSIGKDAFNGCIGLTSVDISNVPAVGSGAFCGCTGVTKVVLCDTMSSIPDRCFEGCSSLEDLVIPDSVTKVGSYAFSGTGPVSSLTLANVTQIGSYAFSHMVKLVSVDMPKATLLGIRVFEGCSCLTTALVKANSVPQGMFKDCVSLTTLPFGNSVVTIGNEAFSGCTGLTSVDLSGVSTLGNGSFRGCTGIASLILSEELAEIPGGCFEGCTSLSELTIPESVISVGGLAFSGCSSLVSIDIPSSTFSDDMVGDGSFALGTKDSPVTCNVNRSSELFSGEKGVKDGDGNVCATLVFNKEKKFTLTLSNCDLDPISLYAGQTLDVPQPERKGFDFTGWNIDIPEKMPAKDFTAVAQWVVIHYTITYVANGGFGKDLVSSYTYDVVSPLMAYDESVFGSETGVFECWSVTSAVMTEVSSTKYLADNDLGNVTIYAFWKELDYKVVFDANGGTGSMYGQAFDGITEKALRTNQFGRTGYLFQGWSDSSSGSVKYADHESVSISESMTLYAVWAPISYTIMFDANGGEGSVDPLVDVHYDESYTIPSDILTRTGYTMVGWSKDTTVTTVQFEPGKTYNEDKESNLASYDGITVTLHAVWKAHVCYIEFIKNSDSAEGEMSVMGLPYGQERTLTECAYTNKFYGFQGWSLSLDGEVIYQDGSKVLNLTPDDGAVVRLYAVWSVGSYKVVYDPGDGDEYKFDYPVVNNFEEYTIADNMFTYAGHHFLYWIADGGAEYHPGDVVTNLSDGKDTVVLCAVWEADQPVPSDHSLIIAAGVLVAVAVILLAYAFVRYRI